MSDEDRFWPALILWRHVRRLVVLVVGSTVLLAGVIMIVTPGPAIVLIPAGLAILAIEFVWARRLLHRVRDHIKRVARRQKDHDPHQGDPDADKPGT